MLDVYHLAFLCEVDDFSHIQDYLKAAECASGEKLDQALQEEIIDYSDLMLKEDSTEAAEILLMALNPISKLLKQAGYRGQLLRAIRIICLKAARKSGIKRHIRTELFRWANYHLEEGEPAKAMELYTELIHKNHDALGRAPVIAEIRQNMALAYQRLGNPSKAIDTFKKALESLTREFNELNPHAILLMNNQAAAYCDNGEYEKAVKIYLECLGSAKLAFESSDDLISTIYEGLGWAYQNLNRLDEARSCYLKSLSIVKQLGLLRRLPTTSIYVRMGQLFRLSGKLHLARNLLSYCLGIRESELGLDHPDTNDVRKVLARVYTDLEIYDESIPLRRQILDFQAKSDCFIATSTLTSIHELAEDLYWTDELKESEQLYREALSGRIAALGDDDDATMSSRYGLARCLSGQERYGEAIELRRVELAWCQANVDVDTKDMLISMHDLGCDLLAGGDTEEALEVLRSCLNQRRAELGISDDDTLGTLARVVETLSSVGRQQEGLELSQDVQQALEAELGDNDPRVLNQIGNQAFLYEDIDEMEHAEVLYRRCLAGREAVLGPDHPDTVSTAFNLAEVLSEQDRRSEAIPLRRRELAWYRQQNGDTDPGTLDSINGLAIDLRETGELEEAEKLFCELLAAQQQGLEPSDSRVGRALAGLGKTLEAAGRFQEALPYVQRALAHRLEHEGTDSWITNRKRLDLAQLLVRLDRVDEAQSLLVEIQKSIGNLDNSDDENAELLTEACGLLDRVRSES
jgi:tetratricopeptide (TPR) repeat protein